MARVTGAIPNFINGISQQPPALRLPSQGAAQVNCYSTVAKGLMRRPSTETIAKLFDSLSDNAFTHVINRDTQERRVVAIDDTLDDTNPNLLTASEYAMTDFVDAGGATAVTTSHSDSATSVDGVSDFQRVTFDGTDAASFTLGNFHTMDADSDYTFSVWGRLVSGTLTDADNFIYGYGTDFAATVTNVYNDELVTGVWVKIQVNLTSSGSPDGSNIIVGIRCDDPCVIDFRAAQFEKASTASLTCPGGGTKPKIKVFDFSGVEQQVWIPDGVSYLEGYVNPKETFAALTVADYTFIVNKRVVVAEGSTTAPAEEYSALYAFQTIQPGSTVKVVINGSVAGSQAISDTDPSELETNWVAAQIRADMASNGYNTSPWSVQRTETDGSVIYLKNTSADFNTSVRDGSNGLGIKIIKRKVQYFEDLPRQGINGFKVEVAGDPVTGFGNYWVEFDGDENGIPVWKESMKFGLTLDFDASTMPHTLIRNASGTFTFKEAEWTDRAVGDEDSNPMPSFVGETINDVFFAEGRLAFLSAENVIMSEAGEFFNFFRTTVTTLVDGDPIDVGTNHTKVSILRHSVPYQEQLLMFSDQTQFRLTKGDILSPSSVGIEPITEFESSILAKPAPVGNFVFFAVEKSDFASLREYFVADDSQRNDARDITGHVPNYIPSGVTAITGSSNEDVVLVETEGDLTKLFVYKFFWSGNEKVQSSWSYWTWPDVTAILGKHFIQSDLYLVVKRADGVFLEKMELDTGAQDASGTGFSLAMDRKILSTDTDHVSVSYSAITDLTTYTFSQVTWKSVPLVIGVVGNEDYPPGYSVTISGNPDTYDSNTIVLEGDTTGETFLFGIPFDSEYHLSEVVMKAQTSRGSEVPVAEGRLQLMYFNIVYADTGYFKVTVTAEGREPNEYIFNGRQIGSEENVVAELPIDSGSLRVPVMSKSNRVSIKITTDSVLPMRIISTDWVGNFHAKTKRL